MPLEKIRLTTTLNRLRAARACAPSYKYLIKRLGGPSFDRDAPINLLTILDYNGVADCLWALRATEENCEAVARLMAADFAAEALPIYEREFPNDPWPRDAIAAARAFAHGEIEMGGEDKISVSLTLCIDKATEADGYV